MIIGFISIKGGVGKTTLAMESAASLANNFHKKVLLVDANFSAPNVGLYLNIKHDKGLHEVLNEGKGLHTAIYEAHGFDVVPASLIFDKETDVYALKRILSRVSNRYDFIIIDSSPNYRELKPVVAACDKLFIVSSADEPTLATSMKAALIARTKNTPVEGIIVNKIRNPKFEMSLSEIEGNSQMPVMARIPEHKKMAESIFYRTPIVLHSPKHAISNEIRSFVGALCGEIGERQGFFNRLFNPFSKFIDKEKINREMMRQEFYKGQFG